MGGMGGSGSGTGGSVSLKTTFDDSPNLDAFGRLRAALPKPVFDEQFHFNLQPLIWEQENIGGGAITHLPLLSGVSLTVGTADGDRATIQTKKYFKYQTGISQALNLSVVIGASKTNLIRRVGLFDDDNGMYFQLNGEDVECVLRSNVSGSTVITAIPQTTWNLDRLDGKGGPENKSQRTLNVIDIQSLVIDFQWAAGRIRYGFYFGGEITYVHEITPDNNLTTPLFTTPNLPIRYEIENLGVTASPSAMIQLSQSIISENGSSNTKGLVFSGGNQTTGITVTTTRAICSIRPKLQFNSIVNRGIIEPVMVEVFTSGSPIYFEVLYNATLTGDAFASFNDDSLVELDTTATVVTNGLPVASGYVASGKGKDTGRIVQGILSRLPFTLNKAGDTPDRLTIIATRLSGGGDGPSVFGAFTWMEDY